jgi:ATP-dependent RNA helicase DDX55/SPB4
MSQIASTSTLAAAPSYAGPWSKVKPALHAELIDHVVHTLGFQQMTPVQSGVIPLFLSHKDVIVEAVTGSGKTLAYVVPILQMLMQRETRFKRSQVGALIVCPTRELAIQIYGVIEGFLSPSDDAVEGEELLKGVIGGALLAVGGSKQTPADDYRLFKERGADIVVGTPGRVEELLKRANVDVKELEVLVLDEADRLLDLGFSATITSILHMLPKQRRTGLFSATMTEAMGELVRVGLRNPVRVVVKVETKIAAAGTDTGKTITEKRMPASLDNYFTSDRPEHKTIQMVRILLREMYRSSNEQPMRKGVVYFATCAQVNYFYKVLSPLKQLQGIKLYSLHGKQAPTRRSTTFNAFVNATPLGAASPDELSSVLLCTDVAARGLDLPDLDLVVQFDPPTDPKVFSHRCGRTARAGRRGRAVVMLNQGREEEYVEFLRVRKSPVKPYGYVVEHPDSTSDARQFEIGQQPDGLDVSARDLFESMRTIVRSDRAIYEAGMQAFVSFVQCYRKHEVSFVFRERDLDFGAVAFAFGLLRLPKMPEVDRWRKTCEEPHFFVQQEQSVDLRTFAYADKAREQQRIASLAATPASANSDKRKKRKTDAVQAEEAWSNQKDAKERRLVRKEKKQRKRAFLQKQAHVDASVAPKGSLASLRNGTPGKPTQQNGHDRDRQDDDDNQNDWAEEERDAKRAKKGSAGAGGMAMNVSFDL